jgi:hypothetical protein
MLRLFEGSNRDSRRHRGYHPPGRGADALLAALAVVPPAYAALELSSPMLIFRSPTHAELYAAYRNQRSLVTAGALAGAALFWRALRGEGSAGLAKATAGSLGALAAMAAVFYDASLFKPRKTTLRVLQAEEAFEGDDTEVLGVVVNGEARAYPTRKAARPHLISDTLGGEEISVSYCGLTNSAIAYTAEGDSAPHLSVVSAPSNNILYWDANTGSLVQQLLPKFAHGPATGRPARTLPVVYTTWETWRSLVPQTTLADPPYESLRDRIVTRVMRRAHMKTRTGERPFMAVAGGVDRTLHPKARVFALYEAGEAQAYTRSYLRSRRAVNAEAGGRPIMVLYEPESDIAVAYRRELDGRRLTFRTAVGGGFEDEETGTRWDVLGRATGGELAGRILKSVPFSFDKVFWFGWKRYHQDTALFRIPGERGEPETTHLGSTSA